MAENTRQLPKLLKELCAEQNIEITSFSGDWIFQLNKDGKIMLILGYKFPNNDAALEQICDDKCALSDVLQHNGIPCVPHHYFMRPDNTWFAGTRGEWADMAALLEKYGTAVCKVNSGSGGTNVYKARNMRELEAAVTKIFSVSNSLAIAPYINIQNEFRCIICDGEVRLIYRKLRPFVVGDGVRSAAELIAAKTFAKLETDDNLDLAVVPAAGEKFEISWKHNIGRGASPEVVTDPTLTEPLCAFASSVAKKLNVRFASIDVVNDGEGLRVLEINSGVMMEGFAASSPENYATAKRLYTDAVLSYFNRC